MTRRLFAGLAVLAAQIRTRAATPGAYTSIDLRFADAETPAWDGSNLNLNHAPSPQQSLMLYKNGVLQTLGVDYRFVGSQAIQLTQAYDRADQYIAWYRF